MVYFGMYAKYIFWRSNFWYSLVWAEGFDFGSVPFFSGQGQHPAAPVYFKNGLRRVWISVTVIATRVLYLLPNAILLRFCNTKIGPRHNFFTRSCV